VPRQAAGALAAGNGHTATLSNHRKTTIDGIADTCTRLPGHRMKKTLLMMQPETKLLRLMI